MDLSNDLISKFVKITSGNDKKETKEGTVYGTAVEYDGSMYVKIDGSDLLTPINTTATIKDGERVTIMIKDHNATVTGNITSPSASNADVEKVTRNVETLEGNITEVETLLADAVYTKELDAEVARIDELIAGRATVEELNATNANIEKLVAKDAEIENLVGTKATIEELNATNADIENLKAKDAEIENLVATKASIDDLTATNADIENLKANKADISHLEANYASITQLDAAKADINVLDAEVADIQTLVNGNLTSDNILSLHLTAQNTTVDNAFIKDAMIDSVTANKIMSGTIDTNNVTIQSTDGSMLLQGTLLQMKDENGKVRIQIGKDGGGNFTFVLYDANGTGVLIDEEGIKSSDAIADGLIVDAKVAENANIAGSKLDIASVITEVNNDNSTTIKSNKIYLDEQGQSLEVAFNSMATKTEELEESVASNTTQINVANGNINTLVAENTSRKQEIQNLDGEIESVNSTLSSKYSSLEQSLDGFKTTVSATYATKTTVNDLNNNLATNYSTTTQMNSAITQKANEITSSVSETYTTKTEFNNLEIGSRNYIILKRLGSYSAYNTTPTYSGTTISTTIKPSQKYLTLSISDYVPEATHYTLSGYITIDGEIPTVFPLESELINTYGNSGSYYKKYYDAGSGYFEVCQCYNGIYMWIIHATINASTSSRVITLDKLKFEKGNKATDWSPAPEDVQESISALTTRVSTAESKLTKDALTTTIGSYYTTSSDVDTQINAKGYATVSQVEQTATSLTATFSASGGYNFIRNSYVDTSSFEYGFNTGQTIDSEKLEPGKIYTLSICGRKNSSSNTGYPLVYIWESGWAWSANAQVLTTYDSVGSVTFTLPTTVDVSKLNVSLYHYPLGSTGSSYFKWVQLTEGSVAHPWSPHPAEVYDGITTIDKDGVKVSQSNYSGYTQMSASGFYVNNGSENVISCTSSGLTVKGTITGSAINGGTITGTTINNGSGTFKVDSNGALTATNANITGTINATAGTFAGTITTNKIMKAYGAVYVGTEIWGGFTSTSGSYVSNSPLTLKATTTLNIEAGDIYLKPTTEVVCGTSSAYKNLRAREIYAQEIVYTDTLRGRTGSTIDSQNLNIENSNGFLQFNSGYGVIRVVDDNQHLYLQTGSTSGNTSSEVRCTLYQSSSAYANLRAHNVCAQNAVYAAGVNVSSDRDRKRDIELYETDALYEVCTTPVYTYHLDTDLDEEIKRIGIIMQEAPLDAIDLSGKGVDLYQMVTMLWKAVQQLNAKIEG